jgi:HSP20 family protein
MAGIIPTDELKRLQMRMNRLMEDLGLSDLESRYADEMQRMQKRISEMMEEASTGPVAGNIFMPLADVRETEDAVVVTMDLPGVDKKDVDITVSGDDLRVAAERKAEVEMSEKDYHKRERAYSRFERIVKLPVAVKMEEAKAKLSDGVLEITLPKEVVTAKKRINIE